MSYFFAQVVASFCVHKIDAVIKIKCATGAKEYFFACYYNDDCKYPVVAAFNLVAEAKSYICNPENAPEPIYTEVVTEMELRAGLCQFLTRCKETKGWVPVPDYLPFCKCIIEHARVGLCQVA